MSALFLALFLLGLVLGVLAMLLGVERQHPDATPALGVPLAAITSRDALIAATRQISARYSVPLLGAFSAAFGASGYCVHRFSGAGIVVQLLVATIGGGVGLVGAIVLIAGWAVPSARRDIPDERFVLQGQLGFVTRHITDLAPGEVSVEIDGVPHAFPARSLDGTEISSGTEVVIDRLEGTFAYVEPWAVVEQRL